MMLLANQILQLIRTKSISSDLGMLLYQQWRTQKGSSWPEWHFYMRSYNYKQKMWLSTKFLLSNSDASLKVAKSFV